MIKVSWCKFHLLPIQMDALKGQGSACDMSRKAAKWIMIVQPDQTQAKILIKGKILMN